jgi:hypothetical protein
MTDMRGRISGNTIILAAPPPALPDGSEVLVHIEKLPSEPRRPRIPGLIKGHVEMSPDFNETPPGFEDYLP